jgi:hypothetical protein
MAALERALNTPGKGKTRTRVIARGAVLCNIAGQRSNKYWSDRLIQLYSYRDDLVHGKMSPFAPRVSTMADAAEFITRQCLLGWLAWSGSLADVNPHIDIGGLIKAFEVDLKSFGEKARMQIGGGSNDAP